MSVFVAVRFLLNWHQLFKLHYAERLNWNQSACRRPIESVGVYFNHLIIVPRHRLPPKHGIINWKSKMPMPQPLTEHNLISPGIPFEFEISNTVERIAISRIFAFRDNQIYRRNFAMHVRWNVCTCLKP